MTDDAMTDAPDELPDHVRRNREAWDEWASDYVANGERSWKLGVGEEKWGIWDLPEAELHLLPDDLAGLDTIELGCGTGYVSAWLARRGARPVGIDNSRGAARDGAPAPGASTACDFPLLHGNAERRAVPGRQLRPRDLRVRREHLGRARSLDPGGGAPPSSGRPADLPGQRHDPGPVHAGDEDARPPTELQRPYFGLHRLEWPDDASVNFHLGYGDWIRLLRANDFEVEDLVELQAPVDATTSYPFVTADWANRWPSEEVWKARKRG